MGDYKINMGIYCRAIIRIYCVGRNDNDHKKMDEEVVYGYGKIQIIPKA